MNIKEILNKKLYINRTLFCIIFGGVVGALMGLLIDIPQLDKDAKINADHVVFWIDGEKLIEFEPKSDDSKICVYFKSSMDCFDKSEIYFDDDITREYLFNDPEPEHLEVK